MISRQSDVLIIRSAADKRSGAPWIAAGTLILLCPVAVVLGAWGIIPRIAPPSAADGWFVAVSTLFLSLLLFFIAAPRYVIVIDRKLGRVSVQRAGFLFRRRRCDEYDFTRFDHVAIGEHQLEMHTVHGEIGPDPFNYDAQIRLTIHHAVSLRGDGIAITLKRFHNYANAFRLAMRVAAFLGLPPAAREQGRLRAFIMNAHGGLHLLAMGVGMYAGAIFLFTGFLDMFGDLLKPLNIAFRIPIMFFVFGLSGIAGILVASLLVRLCPVPCLRCGAPAYRRLVYTKAMGPLPYFVANYSCSKCGLRHRP